MKLLTYNDQRIRVERSTYDPQGVIELACKTTMFREAAEAEMRSSYFHLLKFLISAEHTSVLEHVSVTLYIKNISRSLLAQLTRHRMGSFTSSSQHYQDYRDYPVIVHPAHQFDFANCTLEYPGSQCMPFSAMEAAIQEYIRLVDECGVPPEEARQVLPNAAAVNLLWTVNMRSLLNFFRQRCCNRNVMEMRKFASNLRQEIHTIWPEFIQLSGPPCLFGECNQGKMQCKQKTWIPA